MYQMHPDRASLFAGDPPEPAQAAENVQTIRFDDLLEMRQVVWDLAGFIEEWKPDLVPFFATGGIPYLIPVMHVLERKGQRDFLDGGTSISSQVRVGEGPSPDWIPRATSLLHSVSLYAADAGMTPCCGFW